MSVMSSDYESWTNGMQTGVRKKKKKLLYVHIGGVSHYALMNHPFMQGIGVVVECFTSVYQVQYYGVYSQFILKADLTPMQ